MLDMTVGEGEVATLIVPIGRQIPPLVGEVGTRPGNAKQRINDPIFVHIQKGKERGRRRKINFCQLAKRRQSPEYRHTVDCLAHVVTARPVLWEFYAIGSFHGRSVSGTTVDGCGTVVGEQQTVLDVR